MELLARQLYSLTRGEGEYWNKAQELGRQIDAENPLYRPGGKPDLKGVELSPEPLGASTMPQSVMPTPAQAAGAGLGLLAVKPLPMPGTVDLDLDLSLDPPPAPAQRPAAAAPATNKPLDFDLGDLSLDLGGPATVPFDVTPDGDIDFGDFKLTDDAASDDQALSRKLDLAEEFIQIGDTDGARELVEEVLSKAAGALKADAQALLERLR